MTFDLKQKDRDGDGFYGNVFDNIQIPFFDTKELFARIFGPVTFDTGLAVKIYTFYAKKSNKIFPIRFLFEIFIIGLSLEIFLFKLSLIFLI